RRRGTPRARSARAPPGCCACSDGGDAGLPARPPAVVPAAGGGRGRPPGRGWRSPPRAAAPGLFARHLPLVRGGYPDPVALARPAPVPSRRVPPRLAPLAPDVDTAHIRPPHRHVVLAADRRARA